MNPKISKLQTERERNNAKISGLQTRNREIDGQITELENLDIIGLVRENGLTPEMLGEIIRAMKKTPLPVITGDSDETEADHEEN